MQANKETEEQVAQYVWILGYSGPQCTLTALCRLTKKEENGRDGADDDEDVN